MIRYQKLDEGLYKALFWKYSCYVKRLPSMRWVAASTIEGLESAAESFKRRKVAAGRFLSEYMVSN